MKKKANAKQRREADTSRKKDLWSPVKEVPAPEPVKVSKPAVKKPDPVPQKTPEEETREFLEYLERYNGPVRKDDTLQSNPRKTGGSFLRTLNLEEGMPLVEDALDRLRMGLQEMRVSRAKAVKLIHGYGSTGRGGKICPAVRAELASMKRKRLIRDYIPGEDFGPVDAASRNLAERNREITRDPDYGRMNHGITIVVL